MRVFMHPAVKAVEHRAGDGNGKEAHTDFAKNAAVKERAYTHDVRTDTQQN